MTVKGGGFSAPGKTGPQGAKGDKGDAGATGAIGPAGSAASATPLGTTPALALATTASAGTSTSAAREDHVHPLPSGRLALIGTYSVGEAGLVTVALAVRRYSLTVTGVTTTDRLVVTLNGIPQNGSLQDVYVSAANTLSVGALVPTLGVAATVAVPIAVYKVV